MSFRRCSDSVRLQSYLRRLTGQRARVLLTQKRPWRARQRLRRSNCKDGSTRRRVSCASLLSSSKLAADGRRCRPSRLPYARARERAVRGSLRSAPGRLAQELGCRHARSMNYWRTAPRLNSELTPCSPHPSIPPLPGAWLPWLSPSASSCSGSSTVSASSLNRSWPISDRTGLQPRRSMLLPAPRSTSWARRPAGSETSSARAPSRASERSLWEVV